MAAFVLLGLVDLYRIWSPCVVVGCTTYHYIIPLYSCSRFPFSSSCHDLFVPFPRLFMSFCPAVIIILSWYYPIGRQTTAGRRRVRRLAFAARLRRRIAPIALVVGRCHARR